MQKVLILFLFKGVGAIASLVLGMLISKYYGLDVLGQYGLFLSYILIFSTVATWGGNIYVIENQEEKIDINYFLFNTVFAFIVSLVSVVFFYNKFNIFYIGGVVFVYSFLIYKSSVFMINGLQYYNALLDDLLKHFIPIIILFFCAGYFDFFEIFFLAQVVLFLISIFLFFRLIVFGTYELSFYSWKDSFFYGVLPTVSALLILLNAQFDRIILSYTVSKEMLGVYYAAQSVMALVTYITVSVMMIITPTLIKLYKEESYLELRKLSIKYSTLLFFISFIILFFTFLFGKYFLKLYGISSIEGYNALLVLLSGMAISQLFGFGMTIYAYTTHKKRLITYQLFVFVLASGLCLIFSKLYGIVGAAFTTAFGFILIKVLVWLDFRKKGIQLGVI